MESNTTNENSIKNDQSAYTRIAKEIKEMKQKSSSIRFHRDTDNLDFDGRE